MQPRILEGIKFLKDAQWVLWTRIVLCVFLFIFYYFWFANLNTGDNNTNMENNTILSFIKTIQ